MYKDSKVFLASVNIQAFLIAIFVKN